MYEIEVVPEEVVSRYPGYGEALRAASNVFAYRLGGIAGVKVAPWRVCVRVRRGDLVLATFEADVAAPAADDGVIDLVRGGKR